MLSAFLVALLASSKCVLSTHLRAGAKLNSHTVALSKKDVDANSCQFVAHQEGDTEATISISAQNTLFRKGSTVVVEKAPLRYLVSLADDGTCNEQAEQVCIAAASQNLSATTCDDSPCTATNNGELLLSYLRSMAGGAFTSRAPPSNSVVIGLGTGALALWIANAFPSSSVDAVDLSSDVIAAAHCFGLHSSNLNIVEDDGRHFLQKSAPFTYDAIFLDAFDASGSMPPCLATVEFYEMLAQRLNPEQGVLSANLGAHDDPEPILSAMQKVFMHVAVGQAPHLTNHLVLASQTALVFPPLDRGPAEVISPGSVQANLTRWARDAQYHTSPKRTEGLGETIVRTDASERCTG